MKTAKHLLLSRLPTFAFLVLPLLMIYTLSNSALAFEAEDIGANTYKRVLMVLSSYGKEQGKTQPGYEFDEFSKAYLVFKANGVNVDLASPQGGAIEADKYDPNKPFNAAVLQDNMIMAKLANTLKIADVSAKEYQGVFVVGGKGAMFDLPNDASLQQAIADIYQQNGSVAAVCHGPAALVDVKLADGSYLIANKAVNGFTNAEEKLFGKKWINHFEFMLEDKLVERGAKFQSSPIMLSHVAVDSRLITGQNPSSTVAVATELVKSMGIEPVTFNDYEDDRTLSMVARVLDGDEKALTTLMTKQSDYDIELVGMYGYNYLQTAENDAALEKSLTLMTLAQEAINNPRLNLTIAKTQHKLGDDKAAIATLNQLLASKPDFEPAQEMLKSLSL
ncbi:MAG: type 1 glutamine amidotransferase domain-containing protein [Thalassotalea sp.]|nr:type 1 glutamine amidotransferase domain-containing protein [Thalassotalea sp.]